MRVWLLRLAALALFGAFMYACRHVLLWGFEEFGVILFLAAWLAVFFGIAWWLEPRWKWTNDD